MKKFLSKYGSVICISLLILLILYVSYRSFFAYLGEHSYYNSIFSTGQDSGQNRGIIISALLCVGIFPVLYFFAADNIKFRNMILWTGVGAAVFGLIHCHIKLQAIGAGNLITLFNTLLLFSLGVYLIIGFAAVGSRVQRKLIRFQQQRWQEMLLSFGLGMIGFIIIVQVLLGLGLLYGIVSWILFLGLGFMIRYERKGLKQRGDLISGIFENMRNGVVNSQLGNGNKMGFMFLILSIISLAYVYIGIQNSFIPYSTAWDANHEYMYTPKILAENAGVYWGNTVGSSMPGLRHQFITFIFSLTGATNGRFGLSSDNIAVSMNFISAILVLIFGIAVIFQIFSLIHPKESNTEDLKLEKGKNKLVKNENVEDGVGISIGWLLLLLRLTSGMGAFIVIVDNKTDFGVMALSLLALLAGLIFLQNKKNSDNKSDILKYLIITGLFFGFATLAKITAFVDFVLFGLLVVGLWFGSITTLGVGIMMMGIVRKFNILTSSVMLTESTALRLIIIGAIIFIIGLILHLLKYLNRKDFGKHFNHLIILGLSFLIPLFVLKLPWVIISEVKTNSFSIGNSFRSVFLVKNLSENKSKYNELLAQNISDEDSSTVINSSLILQNSIDSINLKSKSQKTFNQCLSAGDIYSKEELNEGLQELTGGQGGEDFGRYIGYGWKKFTKETKRVVNNKEVINKNGIYWLLKMIWPTSDTCYGFNHDAKVLCNNADVINSFKIDDLRAIYENGIKDKDSEAGLLLKVAIDSYDEAKSSGRIGFMNTNLSSIFYDEIVNLRQYYQSHSISSDKDSVSIPYRYIVPFNISFNWSLQNLSSYYTDIGFFWIVIYILLLITIPYAIVKKDKILTLLSLTTLIGWGIWWIIGSAILWYGTVLISWSMITLAVFFSRLFKKEKEEHPKILLLSLLIVIIFIFSVQLLLNFLRIASQGSNSIFVWYKGNVGKEQIVNQNLQFDEKVKYGYNWKNVFDLQFSQYNPIINYLNDRKDEDGVIVAGTYIQYFLGNQWNIKSDGMLSEFWKKSSDGDLCKIYWRLKDDNTRYLIIDPNIGTVTMGEGNETLFYRFFGKLSNDKSKIEMDGTIITLIRLARSGYLKLVSTNNIGSKYAFTLDDEMIRQYFGANLSDEDLILTRAKMAVLQYFDDANSIFQSVMNMFITRVIYDIQGSIEDIADIYGYIINSNTVKNVASKYISGQAIDGDIKQLTNNEKAVLVYYLNIYYTYKGGDSDSTISMIQNLLLNSVSGGSQIIALELN